MRNQGKTATPRQRGADNGVQLPERRAATVPAIVPGSQLLFRVSEAMEMLSLTRSPMYKLLRSGRIRSVGKGRARRITASALLEYIDFLEREEAEQRHAAGPPRRLRPARPAANKEDRGEQEDR